VIVLLMWLYITAYIVLLGAEVNAEAERQTMHDTTVGPEQPKGSRRAVASDTTPADAGR
jgi:membrane protein